MIKPLSIQNDYSVIFSGDPALDLPDPGGIENDEERAKVTAERDRLLKVARETGQWESLIKPGEKPTIFNVRHLNGSARDFLDGEVSRRKLQAGEFASLIFRLGIKSIVNFGDIEVRHDTMDGFRIATADVINKIRAYPGVGDLIVAEIGGVVAQRTYQPIDPL